MGLPEVRAIKTDSAPAGALSNLLKSVLASDYWVLYLSVAYFLLLWSITPRLASGTNLSNIFSNMLPLLVVAVGQTFVLVTGGIDLSVTSIIALASVVGATVMTSDGGLLGGSALAAPLGIGSMLMVGALVGLFNGTAVTRLGMPPFIVTLTGMMFFGGLAVWLTRSQPIYNLPGGFSSIATGSPFIIPNALIATGLLVFVAHIILRRTILGRQFYAVGANAKASLISGVPVRRTITWAYVISGVCAAAASVLYTGRLETGSPVLGQRILLDVIGACVIGGTSLFGGKGAVAGTIFGVLFITLIDNSLNMLGLSYFTIMMVKGGVILLAALVDVARTKYLALR